MTDTISRTDALAAIEAKRISYEGTMYLEDSKYNEGLDDALAAINALPAVGWRDIESAPRDGTLFVAIAPVGAETPHYMYPFVMRHEGKLYSGFQYNNGAGWVDWPKPDPTHWMPLPEAP